MTGCATLMGDSVLKLTLRLRGGEVRGCATLMGVSEVTSEAQGWRDEGLCDFDGGF